MLSRLLGFNCTSISDKTRKRGNTQRVARPARANATVRYLLTCRLAMLLPLSIILRTLKTSAHRIFSLREPTIRANASTDLRGYWTKVDHETCSRSIFDEIWHDDAVRPF